MTLVDFPGESTDTKIKQNVVLLTSLYHIELKICHITLDMDMILNIINKVTFMLI